LFGVVVTLLVCPWLMPSSWRSTLVLALLTL